MYINRFNMAWNEDAIERKKGRWCYFGGGGSSPSGNTTTTQTNQPWSGQEAFLSGNANPNLSGSASPTGVFQSAAQLYNNPSDYPQLYPGALSGSETAPFSQLQSTAYNTIGQTGLNSSLMNQDEATQQSILSGSLLNQGNPYWQSQANQVMSTVQPELEQQFTQGNATDNPNVAYATSQGVGTALGNVAAQNYNNALQQMTQESLYAPNTYQSQLQGQEAAATAGGAQQTQAQDVLNGQINAYNYQQQLPYTMLQNYAGLVNGNYGGTSTTTQPYYNNNAQNLFGDATQLGGLGLMGYMALSDIRLKKNIHRIGNLVSGIPVYIFEYLWSTQKHIGCMAHEVEEIIPEAVIEIMDVKHVRYSMVK